MEEERGSTSLIDVVFGAAAIAGIYLGINVSPFYFFLCVPAGVFIGLAISGGNSERDLW